MRKPPKRKTLAQSLLDAFFPVSYDPPPNRVRQPLVGWSGLPTDQQPPPSPYAWGQQPPQSF